ncbi:NDP-hexose 2,3-dehydratase family protein [Actinomadura nitritigenes]|uniref:NDP-hexose 2,3-dehydratase family protein n=1 Tax=Actinomadura nitritigenes TaxID=134602 RepID=UPI003D8D8707
MPARTDDLGRGARARLADRLAVSALTTASDRTPEAGRWLDEERRRPFTSALVPLEELADPGGWRFTPGGGNLAHRSGRFFTVEGMHVTTDRGPVPEWWQPVLVQRDIAILGVIAKEFDGVLHFLLQAKMEPGNADMVQLSPTVQATPSNYGRVHRGRRSHYVEYFTGAARGRVLVDVLQSEQGAWFHLKRNRNVVVEVFEDVPVHDGFRWLTLGQIGRLLRRRNVINMDARTVLGCLLGAAGAGWPPGTPSSGGAADRPHALHSMTDVLSWLTVRKCEDRMTARLVPLGSLRGWRRTGGRIAPSEGAGDFSIVGARVRAPTREVTGWEQPLLAPHGQALAALVLRRIDGTPHALVRAEAMPGYRDTVELGPTVRFMPHAHADAPPERRPPFLDYVLGARERARYDVVLSEEGGRFWRAETRYLVLEADDDFPVRVPPDFAWVTIEQLQALQRHSYQLGIEARTLLFCLAVP